jgi:hypothetical protein
MPADGFRASISSFPPVIKLASFAAPTEKRVSATTSAEYRQNRFRIRVISEKAPTLERQRGREGEAKRGRDCPLKQKRGVQGEFGIKGKTKTSASLQAFMLRL